MLKKSMVAALLAAFLSTGAAAQDAKAVISSASRAMGSESLTSLTYSGTAADVAFLQSRGINSPLRPITNYVRAIDLAQPASRATGATMNPPGGATTGPPAAGAFNQNIAAPPAAMTPQVWGNQVEIWLTPWGFLKGAAANNATARMQRSGGKNYTVLSWSPAVKAPSGASYVVNGYVNDQNMVERVETWFGNNVLGDMHILATYTDYRDFGGLKVPAKMVQTRGGLPFFEVNVTAARANPSDITTLLQPPPAAAGAGGGRGGAAAGAPPAGAAAAAGAAGGRGGAAPGAPAAGAPGGAPGGGRGGAAAGGAPAAGAPAGGGGAGRGAGAPAAAAAAPGGAAGGQRGAPAAGGAPPAAAAATSEKLGDGVYRIMGGYVSLAIDMGDYMMVLEGGDSENRALAVIAEAKRIIPNKPIRYVVNTHPHSDHSTGLSAYVAEGATIVTHQNNKEFFEDAYSAPRTLLATADALAKAQAAAATRKQTLKPKVEGFADKKVYKGDNNQTVELYHMKTNLGTKPETQYIPHSEGWLIVYLPKDKILFQGDFSINPPPTPANDHVMQVLIPNLDRLKLDFERYVPVHATNPDVVQSRKEVMAAVELAKKAQ